MGVMRRDSDCCSLMAAMRRFWRGSEPCDVECEERRQLSATQQTAFRSVYFTGRVTMV